MVADDDEILAASEEAVARYHDRTHGAMVRIALAPCSPFTVTEQLMVRTAELAERLDVRLHTHFAENAEDDEFSIATFGCRPTDYLERTGWLTDRAWLAHCVMPNAAEVRRLGLARVGVAHCPSSNMILSSGIAPVTALRAAGVPVGLGVDGSSSADAGSLWLEARQALLVAKLRDGAASTTARTVLEMATLGGADCLGRRGELGVLTPGAVGDVAVWSLRGPTLRGRHRRPGRGVAAVRAGRRSPYRRRRTGRRARRRPDSSGRRRSARGAPPRSCPHAGTMTVRRRGRPDWAPMTPSPGRVAVALAVSLLAVLTSCAGERGGATAPPFEDAGTTSLAGTPASTTAPPIESIAMVGDSITNGSKVELLEQLATLGVEVKAIDAEDGRRIAAGDSVTPGYRGRRGLWPREMRLTCG